MQIIWLFEISRAALFYAYDVNKVLALSIIVTGGADFIGSNFILDWFAQSDETIININDRDKIDQILDQYRPRVVLNFVAESHVDRSIHSPTAFIETNIVGTFNLLEFVRDYWNELVAKDKEDFHFL